MNLTTKTSGLMHLFWLWSDKFSMFSGETNVKNELNLANLPRSVRLSAVCFCMYGSEQTAFCPGRKEFLTITYLILFVVQRFMIVFCWRNSKFKLSFVSLTLSSNKSLLLSFWASNQFCTSLTQWLCSIKYQLLFAVGHLFELHFRENKTWKSNVLCRISTISLTISFFSFWQLSFQFFSVSNNESREVQNSQTVVCS